MISDLGQKIICLRRTGMPVKQIEKKLGCSRSTVSKWCSCLANNDEIAAANTEVALNAIANRPRKVVTNRAIREKKAKTILRSVRPDNPEWSDNYRARLREANKAFLLSAGDTKCVLCGYNRSMNVLTFHHIDPDKKQYKMNGVTMGKTLPTLIEEASKCVILCRNCHGEIDDGLHKEIEFKPLDYTTIEVPSDVIAWHYLPP